MPVVVDGVDGIAEVEGEVIVLSLLAVLLLIEDVDDDVSLVLVAGVGSVVVDGMSPFRTLLIVFNSGYFPC